MTEEQDRQFQSQGEPQPILAVAFEENPPVDNNPEGGTEDKPGFRSFIEKNFLAVSILVSGVMIASSVLYSGGGAGSGGAAIINGPGQPQQEVNADVSIDDDAVLGSSNAKVTIIEFSDYQCPFCRSFWKDTLSQIKKEYIDTGKVRFIYRDYPLAFHDMAMPSAQAAECARDQGKYWEMHDKIFSEQDKKGQGTVSYTIGEIKQWAGQIGLNPAEFNKCLDSEKYKDEVDKDMSDGTAAGVSGTPSAFINGRMVVGAQPFSVFKAIIEEELKKSR